MYIYIYIIRILATQSYPYVVMCGLADVVHQINYSYFYGTVVTFLCLPNPNLKNGAYLQV